jgi:RNA polymerase sigma-70 factor (ECF subfamily)
VITLCDIDGLTQAEYARLKGLTPAGAKSRIQRARKRLKQQLKKACQVRYDETGRVCCFTPRPFEG